MPDNPLDEIFKSQLHGHESIVPEDMWERINRKKDKDRGFFFFFKLSGFFLLGAGLAFLVFNKIRLDSVQTGSRVRSNTEQNSDTKDVDDSGSNSKNTGMRAVDDRNAGAGGGMARSNRSAQKRKDEQIARNKTGTGFKRNKSTSPNVKSTGEQTQGTNAAAIIPSAEQGKNSSAVSKTESSATDTIATLAVKSESKPNTKTADSTASIIQEKSNDLNATKSKWSLDLYVSPDYPFDYKDSWFNGRLSFTAGLRINRSFGEHFTAKAGIQFSEINYDSGDSSALSHLMSFDIPVLAGYSWGNEKIGFSVNTGVIVNIYTWSIPNYSGLFKTNTGLSLYLGFNFKRRINERLDIFTEPYYRYRLTSMTESSVPYLKFIDVAGLSFGIRYHLKKKN